MFQTTNQWIKAIWGWSPLLTNDSQWGRYNLPRLLGRKHPDLELFHGYCGCWEILWTLLKHVETIMELWYHKPSTNLCRISQPATASPRCTKNTGVVPWTMVFQTEHDTHWFTTLVWTQFWSRNIAVDIRHAAPHSKARQIFIAMS